MIVGREEGCALDMSEYEFQRDISDADAVEGGSAPAELVQDGERARGGMGDDIEQLLHFYVEGGLGLKETVRGSQSSEDSIHQTKAAGNGRHVASHLRHYQTGSYTS